jgi:hypothetical protein
MQDKEVFLYQQQRSNATRVWLVPFVEFCDTVDELIVVSSKAVRVL